MKTLYITKGNNLLIDEENHNCSKLKEERQGIDSIFLVKEPMHIIYGYDGEHEEFDVDTNDIVISFYASEFSKKLVVVKNEDWASNIAEYNKFMQEEKERWANGKDNAEKIF